MNSPQDALYKILELCYEEEYEQLTKELSFIENSIKDNQKDYYYINLIKEVMEMIYICAEDFDPEIYLEIEKIFTEVSEF
jgi:hypothetical protein